MKSINDRLEEFKKAIADRTIATGTLVRKFIAHGPAYCLRDDEHLYFELKNEVATFFEVHPSNVFMVGSGKLGFSIAPNKLYQKYDPVGRDSDIDIVVVSPVVFERYWRRLYSFNIDLESRTDKEDEQFREFLEYMLKGWIRPDKFPFDFEGREQWFDFFKKLKQSQRYSQHSSINCAVYKDLFFFENYHNRNIENLRGRK